MKSMKNWLNDFLSTDPRRAARKKRPPLVAYFWDGGRPVAHTVQDISHTGFYMTTSERWLAGTLILMTLRGTKHNSHADECAVVALSRVVHHGKDGVGFEFVPVDAAAPSQMPTPGANAADRKALDRFLHRLAH